MGINWKGMERRNRSKGMGKVYDAEMLALLSTARGVSEMCNTSDCVPVIWSVVNHRHYIVHSFISGHIRSTLVCVI